MEQSRCSVIKNLDMFPKFADENLTQQSRFVLPAPVFNHHPSLVLPPILSFGNLAYPPSMVSNNRKNIDFFNLFPPIGFNEELNKSLAIHPTPTSARLESGRSTNKNNLTEKQGKENEQDLRPHKKPKFDFSIKALTAKPHHVREPEIKKPLPLQESSNHQNIANSMPKPLQQNNHNGSSIKSRGRPSADLIEILKQDSMQNPHRYSCSVCHRSFPRKKSLDTHRLTHSDIKPYACDFPGCNRKFKQSGQLKTHLRLHTGEKPFKCTFPYCETAFTHANRKCSQHPEFPLRRSVTETLAPQTLFKSMSNEKLNDKVNMEKVRVWFKKYLADRETKFSDNKENIPPSDFTIKQESSDEEICIVDDDQPKVSTSSDESNKRLLSAVALVELRDQTKEPNSRKDNYRQLFSTNYSF